MDRQTRRRYYNLCNPDEALPPHDPRNVDLDATEDLTKAPRGFPWVQELSQKLDFSDGPLQFFLTGLPGSGKSTELLRLAQRLEAVDGPHLFPAVIDAEGLIDLNRPIDVPEILMAALFGAEQAVLELELKDPNKAAQESLIERLWHWFEHTSLEMQQLSANASAGYKVPALGGAANAQATVGIGASIALKTDPSLRQRVRESVGAQLPRFLEEIGQAFLELQARVQTYGYNGLVVILDSLEKLRGLSSTWQDVLKSAEGLVENGAPYLRLPVHAIYTVPTALTFRVNLPPDRFIFLPMLKLTDREGVTFEPGMEAGRALIRRRVPDEALREQLGEDFEAMRDRMIRMSGGYPREIVRLLRMSLLPDPMSEEHFERLLARAAESYRQTVPGDAFETLAAVHVFKDIKPDDENRNIIGRLFQNNVLLRYTNRDAWYDVHPSVLDIREMKLAVKHLQQAAAG